MSVLTLDGLHQNRTAILKVRNYERWHGFYPLRRKQTEEAQEQTQGDWLGGKCSKLWWLRLRWLWWRCWKTILFTMTVDPTIFARALDLKICNGCIMAAFYCLGMSCLIYLISCWQTPRFFLILFPSSDVAIKMLIPNYYTLLQESVATLFTDNKLSTKHRTEVF